MAVGRRPKTPVIRLFMQYERVALEQNIILVSKMKQVGTYGRKWTVLDVKITIADIAVMEVKNTLYNHRIRCYILGDDKSYVIIFNNGVIIFTS